jgi:hypothetical protein
LVWLKLAEKWRLLVAVGAKKVIRANTQEVIR